MVDQLEKLQYLNFQCLLLKINRHISNKYITTNPKKEKKKNFMKVSNYFKEWIWKKRIYTFIFSKILICGKSSGEKNFFSFSLFPWIFHLHPSLLQFHFDSHDFFSVFLRHQLSVVLHLKFRRKKNLLCIRGQEQPV